MIALGFAGGFLGAVAFHTAFTFPTGMQQHALLSAPFLAFIAFVIILMIFHRPIGGLLSRGNVTLKWGDKEISVQDIEESFEKEFDARLEFLSSEIEDLRMSLGTTSSSKKVPKSDEDALGKDYKEGVLNHIGEQFHTGSKKADPVIFHLGSSKYKWRNMETLAKRTGFSMVDIDEIANAHPQIIVRSQSKSGNIILRLTDAASTKFAAMTREFLSR
jgi:hypothetical protein